jgi:hypothetical protein
LANRSPLDRHQAGGNQAGTITTGHPDSFSPDVQS